MLTREQILEKNDIKTEEVYVEEWGDSVLVRGLTGYERDLYQKSVYNTKTKEYDGVNAFPKLIQMCVIDKDGKQIFTKADIDALGKKSASSLEKVGKAILKLSGLDNDSVEEEEKN